MQSDVKIRTTAEVIKNRTPPPGIDRRDNIVRWHEKKREEEAQEAKASLPFIPRHYQRKLIDAMMYDYDRAVVVWHRRSGKELVCWNLMIFKALHDRVGTYIYYFPTSRLGRRILWDGATKEGKRFLDYAPKHLVKGENSVEMKLEFNNGSIIQIMGTDSILNVGINPVGCVFSEFSLQDPQAWEYTRPILAENDGWAIFNFTPRGQNWAYDLYNMAKHNDKWFAETLTIEDTHVLTEADIEEERKSGMSEDMIQQEFYCSYLLGAEGSYYSKYMQKARLESRIGKVPYDPSVVVHTAWDLGVSDSTAIIFFQVCGNEVHIIDSYESHGEGLDHYAKVLQDKEYIYGTHWGPHDIEVRELGAGGLSRRASAAKLGIKFRVLPKLAILDGIEAVRATFHRLWIDEERNKHLIKCIDNYRKQYNEKMNVYSSNPVHDWTSHFCDALRYLATSLKASSDSRMSEAEANALEAKYRRHFL